jgi:fructokinase
LRVFDINLRRRYWSRDLIVESLELADVLKLNDEELPVVSKLFGWVGDESDQMRQLAARYELKAVAFTKGARGSLLLVGGNSSAGPAPSSRLLTPSGRETVTPLRWRWGCWPARSRIEFWLPPIA